MLKWINFFHSFFRRKYLPQTYCGNAQTVLPQNMTKHNRFFCSESCRRIGSWLWQRQKPTGLWFSRSPGIWADFTNCWPTSRVKSWSRQPTRGSGKWINVVWTSWSHCKSAIGIQMKESFCCRFCLPFFEWCENAKFISSPSFVDGKLFQQGELKRITPYQPTPLARLFFIQFLTLSIALIRANTSCLVPTLLKLLSWSFPGSRWHLPWLLGLKAEVVWEVIRVVGAETDPEDGLSL